MSELLSVRRLNKSFMSGQSQLQVLRDLDLSVRAGELVAISGASGSGKSTLLHVVGAMEHPDSGEIRFGQQLLGELDIEGRAKFRNREIGFVFQFHHLLPEFNALENVMMPLLLRRGSIPKARKSARKLLDEVGLGERASHRPGELSGGERQRVALARALVGSPRILLADEPTGDLDDDTSESIHDLLTGIHSRLGLTAIIVTHESRLAELCESHYRLEGGKLLRA
jgi:lipoprotein-releasing system ATP-binding protein